MTLSIVLTNETKQELNWWIHNIDHANKRL
jgi:hypothetical protein